ncbi:MAG: TatD family hydrolase [Halobacteriales archaeon]
MIQPDDLDLPVVDDHLHLDPVEGSPLEAAREFAAAGGSHLFVVNKPSWSLGVEVAEAEDFERGFDLTLDVCRDAASALDGDIHPVFGVHPALISRLVDRGMSADEAADLMREGLDVAAGYVEDGAAVALKSGRPHYDVSDEVWRASNDVIDHAFELGARCDCAVQLHAEAEEEFGDVGDRAVAAGMERERVVKHYSSPGVEGVTPSVLAREDWLREALENDRDFAMETDFLDDPERPGAVLGPRTVPRRVRSLLEEGYREGLRRANVDVPERVYGVSIER